VRADQEQPGEFVPVDVLEQALQPVECPDDAWRCGQRPKELQAARLAAGEAEERTTEALVVLASAVGENAAESGADRNEDKQ
jgi:hypothetical protein